MNNYLTIFLIILNLILLYSLYRKKLKKLFYFTKVKSVDLANIHEVFLPNANIKEYKFPKEDIVVKSFFIDPTFKIVGMTSNYESWILSCIAKYSKNIFEFGTASGKTTALLALNSSQDAKIYSITLDPDSIDNYNFLVDKKESKALMNAKNESIYKRFIFSDMIIKNKIKVFFQDSTKFNDNIYKNSMDLIFIDGGHNYSCVRSDSEKSFNMIKKNGYIFWHDYVPRKKSVRGVHEYINEITKNKKIFHINNTSLCYYKHE
jgi:predicted O-methyltransferase YrrM